jgi:hypothetical protein
MAAQTIFPRCGARDSFIKGYLPDTCVCRLCQSQLGWQEIPGCGPDCTALEPDTAELSAASGPGAPVEGSVPDGGSADA